MKTENITKSAQQTKDLGRKLALDILDGKTASSSDGAFVLALKGDLGGGKTTFLQGFAEGLGIKEKILSPTFVLMKYYKIKSLNIKIPLLGTLLKYRTFYHIDCYRIKNANDISELGLKQIFSNTENIVAIEWAEKIKNIVPKQALQIEFQVGQELDKRYIKW